MIDSTAYVNINGNYEPINAIATGLIKCTVCKRMISSN